MDSMCKSAHSHMNLWVSSDAQETVCACTPRNCMWLTSPLRVQIETGGKLHTWKGSLISLLPIKNGRELDQFCCRFKMEGELLTLEGSLIRFAAYQSEQGEEYCMGAYVILCTESGSTSRHTYRHWPMRNLTQLHGDADKDADGDAEYDRMPIMTR